jgi:activating signal cointegrator complex subunit 3
MIPFINIEETLRPITRTVLQVTLSITPQFEWNVKYHGKTQSFWIWVEDRKLVFVLFCLLISPAACS